MQIHFTQQCLLIRCYHYRAFSCDIITFKITKENRKQPPCWCTRYKLLWRFSRNEHYTDNAFICVESDKIPLLHKTLTCGFFNQYRIYCYQHTVQVVHQDGSSFLVYGIVIFFFFRRVCDHVMKTLYRMSYAPITVMPSPPRLVASGWEFLKGG